MSSPDRALINQEPYVSQRPHLRIVGEDSQDNIIHFSRAKAKPQPVLTPVDSSTGVIDFQAEKQKTTNKLIDEAITSVIQDNTIEGSIFNPYESAIAHRIREIELGQYEADRVTLGILSKDFYSLAWEVTGMPRPNVFKYHIIETDQGKNLVHDQDLYSNIDILEGVSKTYRRGKEYEAFGKIKDLMLTSEEGTTLVWFSPKQAEGEKDCGYIATQINKAFKANGVWVVEQYQAGDLSYQQIPAVCRELFGQEVMNIEEQAEFVEKDVDKVITTVGVKKGLITVDIFWQAIDNVTGFITPSLRDFEDLDEHLKRYSTLAAAKLLQYLKMGVPHEALNEVYTRLFSGVLTHRDVTRLTRITKNDQEEIVTQTSCGALKVSNFIRRTPFGGKVSPDGVVLRGDGVEKSKSCTLCGTDVLCTEFCHLCGGEVKLA